MSNFLPPPGNAVPIVITHDGKTYSDLTPVWRKWFIDLVYILNKSGGTGGSVATSTTINTTAPLQGGGNLTGNLTLSFGTQAAHAFLAGPSGGPANAPTFRAIVAADLPGISATIVTAKLTALGTDGSMTFVNGILTAQTPAT